MADVTLCSPDGRVRAAFFLKGRRDGPGCASGLPAWQVCYDGHVMLAPSSLGVIAAGGRPADDGAVELVGVMRRRGAKPVGRDRSAAPAWECREAVIRLRARGWSPGRFDVQMRCCNQGVAFRYRLLRQPGRAAQACACERTGFLFPQGTYGYLAPAGTGAYGRARLDACSAQTAFPITLVYPHGKHGCLLEALGEGDAPAQLLPVEGGFRMQTPDTALLRLPAVLPWRVLMVGDCPVDLPMRRDFACAWAEPGTALRGFIQGEAPSSRDHCTWPFVCHPAGLDPDPGHEVAAEASCTRAHRLALPLIFGYAAARAAEPLRERVGNLPDTWEETRFLRGEIGEYVVAARRSGMRWFVAGLTNADGRVLTVRFEDFFGRATGGRGYRLHIWRDPIGNEAAAGAGLVAETVDGLDASDKVRLALAPHGGFVMRLDPLTRE